MTPETPRERAIRLAKKMGFMTRTFNAIDGEEVVAAYDIITDQIERLIALVEAETIERCAVIADKTANVCLHPDEIASAIRALKEQP